MWSGFRCTDSIRKLLFTAIFTRIFEEKPGSTVFRNFLKGFSEKI